VEEVAVEEVEEVEEAAEVQPLRGAG